MGATVATTASEAGATLVKSLGADEIINYKTENFEEILKNYDAVFDTLWSEILEKSFEVIKSGGKNCFRFRITECSFWQKIWFRIF